MELKHTEWIFRCDSNVNQHNIRLHGENICAAGFKSYGKESHE